MESRNEHWGWLATTVIVLFILLGIQTVWFIGTTTLRDYEYFRKEVQTIVDEESRVTAASGAAAASGSEANKATLASLLKPIQLRMLYAGPQLESAMNGILTWNRIVTFGSKPPEMEPDSQKHYEVRKASSITQVLGQYILPFFYGCLGALLAIVQRMRLDDTGEELRKFRPGARLVTGAVGGPMIGMFISPELLNSLAFQATPFVIAFIGGYATDVFFALIDKFLNGFRKSLDPNGSAGGAGGAPSPSPTPAPGPAPGGAPVAPAGQPPVAPVM